MVTAPWGPPGTRQGGWAFLSVAVPSLPPASRLSWVLTLGEHTLLSVSAQGSVLPNSLPEGGNAVQVAQPGTGQMDSVHLK